MADSMTAEDLRRFDDAEYRTALEIMFVSGKSFFTTAYHLIIIGVVVVMIKPIQAGAHVR